MGPNRLDPRPGAEGRDVDPSRELCDEADGASCGPKSLTRPEART